MIDLNHPKLASADIYDPVAEWKQALIIEFGRRFNLRTFIETGTCWGATVGAVLPYFDEIWSVELSPTFYGYASAKFDPYQNIHIIHGSSGEVLPKMILSARQPILFWLDAHSTGGPTASNGDQTGLELEAIKALAPDSLVLIDDCKPHDTGYFSPDAPIVIPDGWQAKLYAGVLVLHGGKYTLPNIF